MLCPFAVHELIPPGSHDPEIEAVGSVGHVAVSESKDIHDYFNGPSGGIESHFYILRDGTIIQYRDTAYEADAQAAGNSWNEGGRRVGLISYESQGMGMGAWTIQQINAIKRLLTWLHNTHPKFKMNPATGPFSGGNGYHAQFKAWNPDNHSCPGPDRIKQFNEILIPWMKEQAKPRRKIVSPNWDLIVDTALEAQKARVNQHGPRKVALDLIIKTASVFSVKHRS